MLIFEQYKLIIINNNKPPLTRICISLPSISVFTTFLHIYPQRYYLTFLFYFLSHFIDSSSHLEMLVTRESLHNWWDKYRPQQWNPCTHGVNVKSSSAMRTNPTKSWRKAWMSIHHQLWQLWNRRDFGELCCCEISLLFGLTCCTRRDNNLRLMDTISVVVVATLINFTKFYKNFTKYQVKVWYWLIDTIKKE